MTEFAIGNIYARTQGFMEKDHLTEGHTHNFDHATMVVAGSFLVTRHNPDGSVEKAEVHAGMPPMLIKAECKHSLLALEDNSKYYCVYAHRLPQGDNESIIVQQYSGWEHAYF